MFCQLELVWGLLVRLGLLLNDAMIYRAAITAKVKVVLELLSQLKILNQIESQYRLVFTTFTAGWVAGEMRIKAKPQAS